MHTSDIAIIILFFLDMIVLIIGYNVDKQVLKNFTSNPKKHTNWAKKGIYAKSK